ncbi:hypothetical protein ANTRET_LOCUS8717 [Anthophora retusa]
MTRVIIEASGALSASTNSEQRRLDAAISNRRSQERGEGEAVLAVERTSSRKIEAVQHGNSHVRGVFVRGD